MFLMFGVLGVVGGFMGVVLPMVVIEELRRRAEEIGVSVDEYLLDLITRDSDPREAFDKYLRGARELLELAKEELMRNNLRQASEKIWGACALAIKAYVLARYSKRVESHRELWIYKDKVAEELGNWIRITFKLANSMHTNFYENLATRKDVEDVLNEVEKLVNTITNALEKKLKS